MDTPTVGTNPPTILRNHHGLNIPQNTARVGDEHLLMPFLMIEVAHLGKLGLILCAEEEQVLVDIVELGVRVEVACLLQLFI